jgi:hypothetical protein
VVVATLHRVVVGQEGVEETVSEEAEIMGLVLEISHLAPWMGTGVEMEMEMVGNPLVGVVRPATRQPRRTHRAVRVMKIVTTCLSGSVQMLSAPRSR